MVVDDGDDDRNTVDKGCDAVDGCKDVDRGTHVVNVGCKADDGGNVLVTPA